MNEQLYKELELLLQTNVGANFYKYRDMYFRIFNKQGPSCKCKGNSMYNELQNMYILEKQRHDDTSRKG